MWTRERLEADAARFGLKTHFWGRTGPQAVNDIERRIGIPLNDDLREFGTHIGAVYIDVLDLFLTGNIASGGGERSTVTETARLWKRCPDTEGKLVAIGSLYDTLFCWAPEADTIRQYYRPRLQIDRPEEEWASLESFLASMLPYLQSLEEDGDEE